MVKFPITRFRTKIRFCKFRITVIIKVGIIFKIRIAPETMMPRQNASILQIQNQRHNQSQNHNHSQSHARKIDAKTEYIKSLGEWLVSMNCKQSGFESQAPTKFVRIFTLPLVTCSISSNLSFQTQSNCDSSLKYPEVSGHMTILASRHNLFSPKTSLHIPAQSDHMLTVISTFSSCPETCVTKQ